MTFQIVRGCGTGDMVGIAEERPWRRLSGVGDGVGVD